MRNVTFTLIERLDLFRINIETEHTKALFGISERKRQPHVSKPHDTDNNLAVFYF